MQASRYKAHILLTCLSFAVGLPAAWASSQLDAFIKQNPKASSYTYNFVPSLDFESWADWNPNMMPVQAPFDWATSEGQVLTYKATQVGWNNEVLEIKA